MATTGADPRAGSLVLPGHTAVPPRIKQFEAGGFRAWPAASVTYDGAWAIRLTAGHPAKRLNSINVIDRGDNAEISKRLGRAEQRFRAYGRPLTVRVTPLTPQALIDHCHGKGWRAFGYSLVMTAPMEDLVTDPAIDQIPLKDVALFVEAALVTGAVLPKWRAGLSEIIQSIEPDVGMFVQNRDGSPAATAICVQDGDIAGLFEVATAVVHRRRGITRANLSAALKWAAKRGARTAWLQVEAENHAAIALYEGMGFRPFYGYHYCQPEGAKG